MSNLYAALSIEIYLSMIPGVLYLNRVSPKMIDRFFRWLIIISQRPTYTTNCPLHVLFECTVVAFTEITVPRLSSNQCPDAVCVGGVDMLCLLWCLGVVSAIISYNFIMYWRNGLIVPDYSDIAFFDAVSNSASQTIWRVNRRSYESYLSGVGYRGAK